MLNSIVRFQEIEINNFKNVQKGNLDFPNYKKKIYFDNTSEIIGLYGQNGSGKTTLIEALKILKIVLSGKELPGNSGDFILSSSKNSKLAFTFYVEKENFGKYIVKYEFLIEKTEDGKATITQERLSYKKLVAEKWTKIKDIIFFDSMNEGGIFNPKKNIDLFDEKEKDELKFSKRYCRKEKMSFIFNDETKNIFRQNNKFSEYFEIINLLEFFARVNLFIVDNSHSGLINANIVLPFSFRYLEEKSLSQGDLAITLFKSSIINKKEFILVKKIIQQMNIVLNQIIPGLEIKIKEYGMQLMENNQEGINFDLISKRGEVEIALKYESEGIKKIVSILSTLIAVYQNSSFCLAIDELDAGIFEYLLGEILEVISKYGKGQLIFTSHNLRPLEVLKKDSLIFTTSNPKNKYIRYSNIKKNNNLRSVYMRSLIIGGQSEIVYEETNSFDIVRAFKRAGRISDDKN